MSAACFTLGKSGPSIAGVISQMIRGGVIKALATCKRDTANFNNTHTHTHTHMHTHTHIHTHIYCTYIHADTRACTLTPDTLTRNPKSSKF